MLSDAILLNNSLTISWHSESTNQATPAGKNYKPSL